MKIVALCKLFIAFLFITTLFACHNNSGGISIPVEHITPTKDQIDTREQSEAFCKLHNIPVYQNKNALYLDPEAKITIRTKDEIVDRLLALCFTELKSEKVEKNLLDDFNVRYNVMGKLSPKEKHFILASSPTQQQLIDANWRAEDMHVLLWALGYIDSLAYPDAVCNVAEDVKIINDKTEKQLTDDAHIRCKSEILRQADLILRLDWACTEARIKKTTAPGNLDGEVVTERHYVLNWLIQYLNQAWDDVSTDT